MRIRTLFAATSLLVVLGGCASTSFKTTWKTPDGEPVELTGKKVVVIAAGVQKSVRIGMETGVADELNKMGAQAISSFQILSPESSKEEAKAKLQAEGYNAAYVIHVTDKEQEVYSSPGTYAPYGAYGSYWGWGGGWGAYAYAPTVYTNTNIYVETLIYSLRLDKLVWSGMSVTTNPDNITNFARELTQVSIAEMKKSKLLK